MKVIKISHKVIREFIMRQPDRRKVKLPSMLNTGVGCVMAQVARDNGIEFDSTSFTGATNDGKAVLIATKNGKPESVLDSLFSRSFLYRNTDVITYKKLKAEVCAFKP